MEIKKVHEYLKMTRKQFEPGTLSSDGFVLSAIRLKDGAEFWADIDQPIHARHFDINGINVTQLIYIEQFCDDCIHVELGSWCVDDSGNSSSRNIENEIEIDQLENEILEFLYSEEMHFRDTVNQPDRPKFKL